SRGGAYDLDVGDEPAKPHKVIARNGAEPGPECLLGLRVLLIDRLEAHLERAVPEMVAPERLERQQAEAHADDVILEIGHPGLLLDVELPAVRALAREDEGGLLEGLPGVDRGGARRAGERERNRA